MVESVMGRCVLALAGLRSRPHRGASPSPRTAGVALVLAVALAAGIAGCGVSEAQLPPSLTTGFVQRCGTHFCLDGKTFYVAGSNTYDLFTYGTWSDDVDARSIDKARIDAQFENLRRDKVGVLRLWMFSHESWHGFEPAKGVYSEDQFALFDYIIASAGWHGVRLLPTLENYWQEYGGIDKRLAWEGLPDGERNRGTFFDKTRCPGCFDQYKAYVRYALTRVNTYTGVAYRDDPTIFAWDLMNEPRYEHRKPAESTSGKTLRAWVDEMGATVKAIDKNHMVSINLEAREKRYGFSCDRGTSFIGIQESPYVDFASAHLYPTDTEGPMTVSQAKSVLKAYIDDSHRVLGKPFFLTEFNVVGDERAQWWSEVFAEAERSDADGAGFWWYNDPRDTSQSDVSVGVGAPELAVFRDFADRQAAKNGGVPEASHPSSPAPSRQLPIRHDATRCG